MLENLKKLRRDAGISQKQLADVIGVSQQSINKYENHNIEPDIHTMMRIAEYFETSVDYLIGRTRIKRRIETTQAYDLNTDETRLIDGYRMLTQKQRKSIALIIENYNEKQT